MAAAEVPEDEIEALAKRAARTASIEDLLIAVASPDRYEDSLLRKAAWDEIKGRIGAAHQGLKRALDFRTATPEGLSIKADVRDALIESGCPPDKWGEAGS